MELELDEGRVYGARYYTAKPMFNAHIKTRFGEEWRAMEDWCRETFGRAGSVWEVYEIQVPLIAHRWYVNNSKFWFREKKDLEWFLLKWQ
jgi:hypothetical protein